MQFKVGSKADCEDPICCSEYHDKHTSFRIGSGAAAFRPAGQLGDYQCDLPVWTYHAILKDIKQNHPKIDYIFVTGDFPAHDSWRQNRTGNIDSLYSVVEGIKGIIRICR